MNWHKNGVAMEKAPSRYEILSASHFRKRELSTEEKEAADSTSNIQLQMQLVDPDIAELYSLLN